MTITDYGEASLESAVLGCLLLNPADRFSAAQATQQLYLVKEKNGW